MRRAFQGDGTATGKVPWKAAEAVRSQGGQLWLEQSHQREEQ